MNVSGSCAQVNALANFTLLTKATNLEVTNRDPADYIPDGRTPFIGPLVMGVGGLLLVER